MHNGTRWTLFFILMITIGLVAFKILKSLPNRKRVRPNVYPNSHNYRLITTNTEAIKIIKPTTTVTVTKPPKPEIRKLKKSWKDRGDIFYREIKPIKSHVHRLDVLLLHGKMFTSLHWARLKTMEILAAHGYRVVAMDLPSYGNSTYKFNESKDKNRAKVLVNFIRKVRLLSPVIVSPSESGRYSLPYIAAVASKNPKAVSGFVSIAVEGTDRIFGKDFKRFPPTLILRGSRDNSLGVTSSKALKLHVPHTREKVIEGAGRACYIDKPDKFHELLLKFLHDIVGQNII
jgi:abhydrolase domain-containing protein 14